MVVVVVVVVCAWELAPALLLLLRCCCSFLKPKAMKNTRKRQVKRIKHAWGALPLLTHCQKLTPPPHLSLSLSIQSHLFSLSLFLFMFFLLQTPKNKNNNKNNKVSMFFLCHIFHYLYTLSSASCSFVLFSCNVILCGVLEMMD